MPRFQYKAVSSSGEVLRGEQEAPSRDAVIAHLRTLGHQPVSANEVPSPARTFSIPKALHWWNAERVPTTDRVMFTGELATLLQAGIPLDNALHMLEQTCGSAAFRRRVGAMRQAVQGGASVADALAAQGDVFDALYINLVRAGEAGGTLSTVMERLATYLENMAALRASVITTLIYPIILLVVAVISLIGLMTFVVPQFLPLFADAGATLPWLTQFVFWIAQLLRGYWWLFLALGAALIWFGTQAMEDAGRRQQIDAALLRAPVLGNLLQALDTARFSRTLGTLLNSGVPLLSAITLAKGVIVNRILAAGIDDVSQNLHRGGRMAAALRVSAGLPTRAIQLIEVGEESGQLPRMLEKVAEIYDREVETKLKRLLTILEPALILGLGGLIAVIIVSILVAILGLNELVV
jgi:general secretion pathway protein F